MKKIFYFAIIAALMLTALASGCSSKDSGAEYYSSYSYEAPAYPNEGYEGYDESEFTSPVDKPLSTLSIDVDTASYSNIRRYLNEGELPPVDAVRVEECINYFKYDYPQPDGEHPIDATVTISTCPWNENNYLARVAVQGEYIEKEDAGASNLVFLLDVSGSMNDPNKLPLVKSAMVMLSKELSAEDKISIVVYAGAAGVVLEGCDGDDLLEISKAIKKLKSGGSTAGGAGINLAYDIAEEYFIEDGNNRVILCTDGDFNVGPSSKDQLEKLVEKKRESGVFLSVLGFGTGNVKDNTMETLADKGNGNYAYIDNLMEAKKVLIDDMTSTLYTLAKDVKIQVEFNPAAIKEYRLVGYDNRRLNDEDFNDDKKDAGEVGAGHSVTVFYELILVGNEGSGKVDDLVFQGNDEEQAEGDAFEVEDWMYVKFRYKLPDEDESVLFTKMAGLGNFTYTPDNDFLFATAVTEFALLLKKSENAADASYDSLIERAKDSKGDDENGYKSQFIQLAELAATLDD
ncbi:MAG: von Willebrand factor type A domain-containing protein [Eubacteriales bacterium]